MGAQFLSHYLTILDIKIIFSIVSNHMKILKLTSDPVIIQTLLCSLYPPEASGGYFGLAFAMPLRVEIFGVNALRGKLH